MHVTSTSIEDFKELLENNHSITEIKIIILSIIDDNQIFEHLLEQLQGKTLIKFVVSGKSLVWITACERVSLAVHNILLETTTLQHLELLFCSQNYECFIQPISEALCKNCTLKTLVLKFLKYPLFLNAIPQEAKLKCEEAELIGKMLTVNKSLEIIQLLANIDDCSPIIKGLAANDTIDEFHMPISTKVSAIQCTDYARARSKLVYV